MNKKAKKNKNKKECKLFIDKGHQQSTFWLCTRGDKCVKRIFISIWSFFLCPKDFRLLNLVVYGPMVIRFGIGHVAKEESKYESNLEGSL